MNLTIILHQRDWIYKEFPEVGQKNNMFMQDYNAWISIGNYIKLKPWRIINILLNLNGLIKK